VAQEEEGSASTTVRYTTQWLLERAREDWTSAIGYASSSLRGCAHPVARKGSAYPERGEGITRPLGATDVGRVKRSGRRSYWMSSTIAALERVRAGLSTLIAPARDMAVAEAQTSCRSALTQGVESSESSLPMGHLGCCNSSHHVVGSAAMRACRTARLKHVQAIPSARQIGPGHCP